MVQLREIVNLAIPKIRPLEVREIGALGRQIIRKLGLTASRTVFT